MLAASLAMPPLPASAPAGVVELGEGRMAVDGDEVRFLVLHRCVEERPPQGHSTRATGPSGRPTEHVLRRLAHPIGAAAHLAVSLASPCSMQVCRTRNCSSSSSSQVACCAATSAACAAAAAAAAAAEASAACAAEAAIATSGISAPTARNAVQNMFIYQQQLAELKFFVNTCTAFRTVGAMVLVESLPAERLRREVAKSSCAEGSMAPELAVHPVFLFRRPVCAK